MTDNKPELLPIRYQVIDNPRDSQYRKFAVIDNDGNAELGNWILAECWHDGHANQIVSALNRAATVTQSDEKLRELVQRLIDNDPNEPISDAGHTVLDLWRHDAKRWLSAAPHPQSAQAGDAWRPIDDNAKSGEYIVARRTWFHHVTGTELHCYAVVKFSNPHWVYGEMALDATKFMADADLYMPLPKPPTPQKSGGEG